jgi:hypothetical protein
MDGLLERIWEMMALVGAQLPIRERARARAGGGGVACGCTVDGVSFRRRHVKLIPWWSGVDCGVCWYQRAHCTPWQGTVRRHRGSGQGFQPGPLQAFLSVRVWLRRGGGACGNVGSLVHFGVCNVVRAGARVHKEGRPQARLCRTSGVYTRQVRPQWTVDASRHCRGTARSPVTVCMANCSTTMLQQKQQTICHS